MGLNHCNNPEPDACFTSALNSIFKFRYHLELDQELLKTPNIPPDLLTKQQEEKLVFFQTINCTNVQHVEHHIITYYVCMQVTVTMKAKFCAKVVKEAGMGGRLSSGVGPQPCDVEAPRSRGQGCIITSAWPTLFMQVVVSLRV